MLWNLGTVFSIFTIQPKFPFSTPAHLSCCSCNIKFSLGVSYPPECKSSRLPGASWWGWGIRRRAGGSQAPSETFGGRWQGEDSLVWQAENEGSDWNCTDNVACSGHLKSRRPSSSSCNGRISPPSTVTPLSFSHTLGSEMVVWAWAPAELAAAEPAIGTPLPMRTVMDWETHNNFLLFRQLSYQPMTPPHPGRGISKEQGNMRVEI